MKNDSPNEVRDYEFVKATSKMATEERSSRSTVYIAYYVGPYADMIGSGLAH